MSLSFPSLPLHFLSFSGASWRLADKQWRMVKNCHLLHHVERDVKGGRTPPGARGESLDWDAAVFLATI